MQGGGLAPSLAAAHQQAAAALASGRAAECFARMVAGLGGPADVLAHAGLATAPVQEDVPAPQAGTLAAMDTRALGLVVVALGGGRRVASDTVDARVGLSHLLPLGSVVQAGQPLLRLHAANADAAQAARQAVLAALQIAEPGVAVTPSGPVVIETVQAETA